MTNTMSHQGVRGRLPVASRDRRPALAALALLLIVGGGLGAGLIVYRTGQQTDVLEAGKTIAPGQTVTAADFTTVRISGGAEQTVAARNESNFIGSVAVTTIPKGALVNTKMFTPSKGIVPKAGQLVGLDVTVAQRTQTALTPGAIVQVWETTKTGQGVTAGAQELGSPVLVYSVQGASGDGSVHLDVLVNSSEAALPRMVQDAAAGQIAVTQHSLDTKPELQTTTG